MKSRAEEAELIALAARLEAANAPSDRAPTRPGERLRRKPAAVGLPAQHSHARAYLGAGAVILGLVFLLLLAQATL